MCGSACGRATIRELSAPQHSVPAKKFRRIRNLSPVIVRTEEACRKRRTSGIKPEDDHPMSDSEREPSERERVEAVRKILKQLYRLSDLGLKKKYLSRIERETIFFLYECHSPGKYGEERPHSAAARARRKSLSGRRIKSKEHGLTYDHAIPLATLRAELKKATHSTDAMYRALRRFVQGVVITTDEDRLLSSKKLRLRMPDGADHDDKFARYVAADIVFKPADRLLLVTK
ncbi:hypothetical protein QWJ07_34575 [Frankia sp. RB7]|nr:hypothetical protein [Frankia sp. RB7]